MINRTRRRLGALALGPIAIGLAACGSPQSATSLVAQGLTAQLAGDVSTAESTYLQAIKLDPNDAVAHYDLGTVYDRQGNRSDAVAEYTEALVIDPSFTDGLFNLAVDTASAAPARAQVLYLKVLALQPGFAAAWLNLGFIVAGDGKVAAARLDWARAASLDPTLGSRIPVDLTSPTPKP